MDVYIVRDTSGAIVCVSAREQGAAMRTAGHDDWTIENHDVLDLDD